MRKCVPGTLINLSYILAQTNTHNPLAVGEVAIAVESHAWYTGGSCAKVRRIIISAPIVTMLVTVTRETGNEEARVIRKITDQQLVRVSVVCSKTVPQSIVNRGIPIVKSGRYGLASLPLKVNLTAGLVINKDNFCELNEKTNKLNVLLYIQACSSHTGPLRGYIRVVFCLP